MMRHLQYHSLNRIPSDALKHSGQLIALLLFKWPEFGIVVRRSGVSHCYEKEGVAVAERAPN